MSVESNAEAPQPYRLSPDARRVFTGLLIGMLVASISQTIVGPAMPRIVAELGGMDHYSWVATAAMLVSAISVPIVGKLSDLYGRRPFYLGGLAIFMLGSLLSGLALNFWWLVAARAVQGLGMGVIMPLSQTIIGDIIPARQRGKYQGWMGAVFGVTSVAGPLAGGVITDTLGWRWLFLIAIPIGLAAIVVIARFLDLPHQPRKAVIDTWGIITLAIGLTATLLATSWGGSSYPWTSPQGLGLFAAGGAFLAAFVLIELRVEEPVIPLRLFTSSIFTFANLAAFGVSMVMFGAIIYIPVYAQGVLGVNAATSGLITLPLMLGLVVIGLVAGILITRTGRYKELMLVGAVLIGVGTIMLARLTATTPIWELVLGVGVLGIGIGACSQQYTLVVQNAATWRDMGVATAATQFFRNVGSTVGIAVFGSILNNGLGDAINRHLSPQVAASVRAGSINAGSVLDPSALSGMPMEVIAALRLGLAEQIAEIFIVCLPIVALIFLFTLLIKPMELRDTVSTPGEAGRELLDTLSHSSGDTVPDLIGSGSGARTRERLLGIQLAVLAESALREDRPLLTEAVSQLGQGSLADGLVLLHGAAELLITDDPSVAKVAEREAAALAERASAEHGLLSDRLRRQIAIAAAMVATPVVVGEIEPATAERHEAVDVGRLRSAANDLTAALLVDIAVSRRG